MGDISALAHHLFAQFPPDNDRYAPPVQPPIQPPGGTPFSHLQSQGQYPGRRPYRRGPNNTGLFIVLGILGGMFLLGVIITLIITFSGTDDVVENNKTTDNSAPKKIASNGGPIIFISSPRFFKDSRGDLVLRVRYQLARPDEVPDNYVVFRCRSERNSSIQFVTTKATGRSRLETMGEFEIELGSFSELKEFEPHEIPNIEVSFEFQQRRISNLLSVRLPSNVSALKNAPAMN